MDDVRANLDTFGSTATNVPVVSHQGVGPGSIALPQLSADSRYYVLINCEPSGKFKVSSASFFAGSCHRDEGGFAGFPSKLLKKDIKVEIAAGTRYWLVLVEKGESL